MRSSLEVDVAFSEASETVFGAVDSKTRKGINFVMLASPPAYTVGMCTLTSQGAIAEDKDDDPDGISSS